jgi:hypothetical protein
MISPALWLVAAGADHCAGVRNNGAELAAGFVSTGAAGFGFSPTTMVPWAYMTGGFQSASTPENPDSPWFFSENATSSRGKSSPWGRASGRSRVRGRPI